MCAYIIVYFETPLWAMLILGNDPLMRQLYELDSPNYDVMENLNPMCAALWRYRTKVSVEHLNVKFLEFVERQDKSNRCEILGEFLKKVQIFVTVIYNLFFYQLSA